MTYQEVKTEKMKFTVKYFLKTAGVFFAGFVLSNKALIGFSPLGVAFVCAAPSPLVLTSALGGAVGTVFCKGVPVIKYFFALFFSAVMRFMYSKAKDETEISSALICFSSLICSSAAYMIIESKTAATLFTGMFEAVITSAVAYFLFIAAKSLEEKITVSSLSQKQLTSVMVSASVLIACLSEYTVLGISVARIAALTALLSACAYGGESSGAIGGISLGIASAAANPKLLFLCGGYGLGGLVSGVFSGAGEFVCCIVFAFSNGLFAILSADKTTAVITLYEVLFASIFFLILPKGAKRWLSVFFAPRIKAENVSVSQKQLSKKLTDTSEALKEMSDTVSKVGEILNTGEEFENIFLKVKRSACKECLLSEYCWEKTKGETLSEFIDATKRIRTGEEPLSASFSSRCAKPKEVSGTLSAAFFDYLSRQNAKRRISQVQSALKLQFESVATLLSSLCKDIENVKSYDIQTAETVEQTVRAMSYHPKDICCRKERDGKMKIDIVLRDDNISQSKLTKRLSLVCDRQLELTDAEKTDKEYRLCFCDRANYRIDFAARQYTNGKYTVCGDAYRKFNDKRGNFAMILSDGMGSGSAAAVDARMTVSLMSKLIKSGFEIGCALGLVNSAMLFKSDDERLATLDISKIDLRTGKAYFYKAGSPVTVIRRTKNIGTARCSALPIGILPAASFDESECTLSDGDIIVMFSDGATVNGDEWIKSEVKNFEGPASKLADTLIKSATAGFSSHEDDVTVLVAVLVKN